MIGQDGNLAEAIPVNYKEIAGCLEKSIAKIEILSPMH